MYLLLKSLGKFFQSNIVLTRCSSFGYSVISHLSVSNSCIFLGVLGSKAKLQTMWEVLLKENFTQEELNSVYAPIGLNIKSESPEEIAISIAAQVIQLRNKKKATN